MPVARPVSLAPEQVQPAVPDRLTRFRFLPGGAAPETEELSANGVPVLHLVFDSRVFFDFDSDSPRPEARSVIEALANAIRQDPPDEAVTVLGHTDAIGGDAFNVDLSRRRAQTVIADLVARGVRPDQLSAVAVGKRQPIAPNTTEAGRARNRRVEFLISGSLAANLAVVARRPAIAPRAQLLRPVSNADSRLAPVADVALRQLDDAPASAAPAPVPSLAVPSTRPTYHLNAPAQYQTNPLGPAQTY